MTQNVTEYSPDVQTLLDKIGHFSKVEGYYPSYVICDIDTRYELLKSELFEVLDSGAYSIFRLKICVIDGLTKHELEVK